MQHMTSLELNYAAYCVWKRCVEEQVRLHGSSETCIQSFGRLAKFATDNFNGLLADYEVERHLSVFGRQIRHNFTQKQPNDFVGKVLHVASELFDTGGHTRVLLNWVNADQKRRQGILLLGTTPRSADIVARRITGKSVPVHKLSRSSLVDRTIEAIRCINDFAPDLVVLHTHPEEVLVPILFSRQRRFPVLMYNHADHVFWLGASVVDASVDFRVSGRLMTRQFRGIEDGFVLPYPLEAQPGVNKSDARVALGIGAEETMLLTMASEHKLTPFREANFFHFADEILERLPNARLYVIGIAASRSSLLESIRNRSRVTLLGVIEEPSMWCAAADYFIEPSPLMTGLAGFDVLRHGAKLIRGWRDYSIYGDSLCAMLPPDLSGIVMGDPSTKHSLVGFVDSICRDINERGRRPCKTSFWESLSGERYIDYLDAMYLKVREISPGSRVGTTQPERLFTPEALNYAEYCNSIWPPINNIESVVSYLLRAACKLDEPHYRGVAFFERLFRWLGNKFGKLAMLHH